ncbi:MAG: hypothetical protein K2Q01_02955, partial [Rickettsiales bacterium]|nr:hypothetical protein [Rickettsiales bacterium]
MRLGLCLSLILLAFPAHAEVTVRKGQGTPAPTQPVVSNNLEAPQFHSDTRNLEAILDKDETAKITRENGKESAPKLPEPLMTIP